VNGRPGSPRRSQGIIALAFTIALAAGVLVTAGATVLARGSALAGPADAPRFFVVARGPLAEATRAGLGAHPAFSIVAEHGIDQLLGETMSLRTHSETLRVLEVTGPHRDSGDVVADVATLQGVDGVVEVIDLGAADAPAADEPRQVAVGAGLIVLGCILFVAGVLRTAGMAVQESSEEIAARYLLGAEPGSLWRPVGAVLGLAALAGTLGAVAATYLGAGLLLGSAAGATGIEAGALPLGTRVGLVLGGCALVIGSVTAAALATRRAVLRITEAPVRLVAMLCLALLLGATQASAVGSVPTDWQLLRGVGRELATCRRGLLDAERTLAATELGALRAYARQDAVLLRLATVQRDEDARLVEYWRESCAALEMRRAELRLLHKAALSPGPPIAPRRPPVTGGLAVAFGEAGRPGKPHAFRNGVGLRVRPGEQIRSTADGTVAFAGDLAGAGEVVVISHGRRTFSVYGRVAEALVVRGMQVEAGEPVARASDEGAVIYFSVRERGKPIDPVVWLREDSEQGAGS
jgi:hypothetical protein